MTEFILEGAYKTIDHLMDFEPMPDTALGRLLVGLSKAVAAYEAELYPHLVIYNLKEIECG